MVDENLTEHGHLSFHFDHVGRPYIFFRTGPHICKSDPATFGSKSLDRQIEMR